MNGIEVFNLRPRSLSITRGRHVAGFSIPPTQAARFDRTKTHAEVEKPICADSARSKLDADLKAHNKAALGNSLRAKTFNQGKKRWIRERNTYVDVNCVSTAYRTRFQATIATACDQGAFLLGGDCDDAVYGEYENKKPKSSTVNNSLYATSFERSAA